MASSASDNESPYGFFFSVYQRPQEMQAEEEIDDGEFTCTTVLMRLWKMSDDSDRYERAGSCECPIWQDEVAVQEQSPILALQTHLTELGIVMEEARSEAVELVLGRVCMEDVMGKTGMWVVMDIAEDWYDVDADDDSDEEAGMVPASEAAVAALEKVEAEEGAAATGCCAICMEEDQVRLNSRMPCRHVFHTLCIEKWLRISSSCPICRFAMPVVDD